MFKDFFVLTERENGLPKLRLTDFSRQGAYLEFRAGLLSRCPTIVSRHPEASILLQLVHYSALDYDYDVPGHKSELLKRQEVLGKFDPADYKSERIYATAADGTKIPVSLVYKKGTKLDGTAPLWLTAYGSYGIPSNVSFSSNRLSMLDRGVVHALAHSWWR